MAGFEDITITWDGQDYTVPANRVLGLVVQVEELIVGTTGRAPLEVLLSPMRPALMAAAFEKLLDHVGAPHEPGEVYLAVIGEMIEGGAGHLQHIQSQQLLLLSVMAPPAYLKLTAARAGSADAEKK